MTDSIWGTVATIIDEKTFEINVTHRERNNKNQYGDVERVRIKEIEVPGVPQDASERSKDVLEQNLKGKFVMCGVLQRNDEGYLVSKVSISGVGGY